MRICWCGRKTAGMGNSCRFMSSNDRRFHVPWVGMRESRARKVEKCLCLQATSPEYFWPWANVGSSELRQIAQLPVINKGIVNF